MLIFFLNYFIYFSIFFPFFTFFPCYSLQWTFNIKVCFTGVDNHSREILILLLSWYLSYELWKCFISGLRCYSISNLKFALFFVLLLLFHGDVGSSVSSTLDSLNIDGYNLVWSDHPSGSIRGGVCFYFKESLPIKILKIRSV